MFLPQCSDLVRACLVGLKPLRGNEQVSKARGWGWLGLPGAFLAAADGEPPPRGAQDDLVFAPPEQSGLLIRFHLEARIASCVRAISRNKFCD